MAAPLTPRETELAIIAWGALKSVDIDFDKLAEIANFKNKASAQACFGPVKKKLMSTDGVVATPSKGGKRAAPTDGEGDDNPTPTKKPRARAKKVQPAPAAVETGDAEI